MRRVVIGALAAVGGLAVIGLLLVAGAFLLDRGPFSDARAEIETLTRLDVDVRLCPPATPIGAGTNLDATCTADTGGVSVHVSGDGVDERRPAHGGLGASFERLPISPLRLSLGGIPDQSTDVLSCRSYALYAESEEVAGGVTLPVSYGDQPVTATIQPVPYLHRDFPDNRWQATGEIPSADEAAANPLRYVRSVWCKWFILPPGALGERPGLVRTYTSSAPTGEPGIHVLGPGGPTDLSIAAFPDITASGPVTFDLRSRTDGTTIVTGDNAIDGYLVPPGTWTVTDRTTGREATVDVGPGQTTRVVSVTAVVQPDQNAPPAATPSP